MLNFIEQLIDMNADVNYKDKNNNDKSILMTASELGYLELVEFLLSKRNIRVNSRD